MKTYYVDELDAEVHWVETSADYRQVYDLLASPALLSADVESTGLDIFTNLPRPHLPVRQPEVAYVWSVDDHPALTHKVVTTGRIWWHNAPFDLLSLDRYKIATLEETIPNALDTALLSRHMDPRPREHGGIGQSYGPGRISPEARRGRLS